MKLNEAITMIDELKPNGFSFDTKMRWLSEIDGKVKTEIIDTHEGADKIEFNGYTDKDYSQHYELLIPYPYDDAYRYWLEAQIDYANGEITKYNNAISLFNTAIAAFSNYYNRTHLPLQNNKINYFYHQKKVFRKSAETSSDSSENEGNSGQMTDYGPFDEGISVE